MRHLLLAFVLVATLGAPAFAHDTMDMSEMAAAFGFDFDEAEITSEEVRDGLFVLFGVGGNIALSIGSDGALMVDDQFPELMPKILAEVRRLGGDVPAYVVNTHWHFDHAQGNLALGKTSATLVSHAHARQMMREDRAIELVGMATVQKAYPDHALPTLTYDGRMQIHWNGETVELIHEGPAHTGGDTAVYFRGRNAVHMGDVYNNSGYPFIDAGNGGSIDGVIAFCQAVLAEIDEDTVVIPGHGPIAEHEDLVGYIAMMTTIRDRIARGIANGRSLAEIAETEPTAEWDRKRGDPSQLINRAYHSLVRDRARR